MSGWRSSGAAALIGLCLAGFVAAAATSGAVQGRSDGAGSGLSLTAGQPSGSLFPGSGPGIRRGTAVGAATPEDTTQSSRPNVVVVLTDDQNDYDLRWMPLTREALGDGGMEFTDAISPHPLCCPARAEMITGQYAQNSGVRHNNGPHGGYAALDPAETIGQWFQDAGYQTGFVGKYLNGYHANDGRNAGWSLWDPLVQGVYEYFDFGFFNDGQGIATVRQLLRHERDRGAHQRGGADVRRRRPPVLPLLLPPRAALPLREERRRRAAPVGRAGSRRLRRRRTPVPEQAQLQRERRWAVARRSCAARRTAT